MAMTYVPALSNQEALSGYWLAVHECAVDGLLDLWVRIRRVRRSDRSFEYFAEAWAAVVACIASTKDPKAQRVIERLRRSPRYEREQMMSILMLGGLDPAMAYAQRLYEEAP